MDDNWVYRWFCTNCERGPTVESTQSGKCNKCGGQLERRLVGKHSPPSLPKLRQVRSMPGQKRLLDD